MRQSRIVKIIENLSTRQQEQFKNFVSSPYFNQHEKTIELLEIILSELNRKRPRLDKQKVFAQLFPKKAYKEQNLHNVMSYLMRLYHRFLAIQSFEKKSLSNALSTVQEAYENGQLEVFKNRAKLLSKSLEKEEVRDEHYYYTYYQLNQLLRDFKVNHVNRSDNTSGQELLNYLDHYYLLERLRQTWLLTAHQMIMNTQYDFGYIDFILEHIQRHWKVYQQHFTIAAYYTVLMMFREQESETHYEQLTTLLKTKVSHFSNIDLNHLHNAASNYCISKINAGINKYKSELFKLYKEGLRNEILLENGKLYDWVYKNIVTLGCNLEEYNWTYEFIHKYQDSLKGIHKENAYNYSLAYYYQSKKEYDKALTLLNTVKFTEVQYHMGGNILLLRTHYELDNTEAIFSLLESLRIYIIRSKKMTTTIRKSYLNLIRFTKQLVSIRTEKDFLSTAAFQKKLENLILKLSANNNVHTKAWLLGKCEELKHS